MKYREEADQTHSESSIEHDICEKKLEITSFFLERTRKNIILSEKDLKTPLYKGVLLIGKRRN